MRAAATTLRIEGREYPKGSKLLGVKRICGIRTPIIEVPVDHPELQDAGAVLDGSFSSVLSTIFVRRGQKRSQRRDTVMHEVTHAFLYHSGLGHTLKALCNVPEERWSEWEEALIKTAIPHLLAMGCEPWV